MREYSFIEDGYKFERVSKRVARAAYNNGLRVLFCPVNLRPGKPYNPEVSVSGKAPATFEQALNAFEYYNPRGNETGRYTAFYIPVTMVDQFTGKAPTAATLGTIKQYDCRYIGEEYNDEQFV